MKKAKRLHDELYLKENRYENPKENFKFIIKILKKNINKNRNYKLLDVGCANGELIYNLDKNFKNLELSGCDIRNDLIRKAKENLNKKIKFYQRDISKNKLVIGKFDIIICAGTISCFDNINLILKNLMSNLKKDGQIYIFSNLNEYDFNVFTRYEDIKYKKGVMQTGWNVWSKTTIKKFFVQRNKKVKFYKFFSKKVRKQNKKDKIRTWTIKLNGKNYFTNGLTIIQNQYLVKIS